MSSHKMKGLLKGLRYISNMFENEKESEMEIGYPTDVKHVAHIGWDGPSVNSPSWMTEFKSAPEYSSAPLDRGGDKDSSSVTWASEDSRTRSARVAENYSPQDVPVPKTSRRNASTGSTDENSAREKSEKSKRRSSKNPSKEISDTTKSKDASQGSESPTKRSEATKKSRRKKSVDGSTKASRSSRRVRGTKSDLVSEGGSMFKGNNCNNDEFCQTSSLNLSEGGEEKSEVGEEKEEKENEFTEVS